MREKHFWAWPIASYLFLGGLGGGMTILATVFDLFFNKGDVFALALLVAAACVGLGCFFLIFELGRPLQFWRVFSAQKAILTFGAWMLLILIGVNAVNFSFFTGWFPWSGMAGLQQVVAGIDLVLATGVVLYTGIMLSSLKARPFWNTPALPVLFTVSGLSTGAAADSLLAGIWPFAGTAEEVASVHEALHTLDIVLVVFELIVILLYVIMMYTSSNPTAKRAASRWLSGSFSASFWGGLVFVGLVLPLGLYALGGAAAGLLAPVLAIIGGIFLRFLVVYSDDRRLFTGEECYWERLPKGDEAFMEAWE
ncbi:MAG: polysulfide reductase NrfD [Coriobacteriia bacterium]|nr:polysulfide reductase NrfD [Coriobacteriia bacterium]